MTKVIAIHGGGDWVDASADYVVLEEGYTIEEVFGYYRKWYEEEHRPNLQVSKYRSLDEYIIEFGYGRKPTDDELEIVWEGP